jgi:hypothetical protein
MKPRHKSTVANGEPATGGTPLPATAAMQRRVNAQVRSYMSEIGAHGGATPSKAPRPRFTSESGREAVRRRWAKVEAERVKQV